MGRRGLVWLFVKILLLAQMTRVRNSLETIFWRKKMKNIRNACYVRICMDTLRYGSVLTLERWYHVGTNNRSLTLLCICVNSVGCVDGTNIKNVLKKEFDWIFLQLQCGGVGANGLAVHQTEVRPGNAFATTHLQHCGLQRAMEIKWRVKPVTRQTAAWVNIEIYEKGVKHMRYMLTL